MKYPLMFLKLVGKGVANAVGAGIAGDLIFDIAPEVAKDVYGWWKKDRKPEERQADLAAVAQASPEEIKQEVKLIVQEVAADKPLEFQKDLEIYLSLIPGQVRQSLRRPSDPGGTTVGLAQVPQREEDILPLLPVKMPKFKPGDRPLPGIDWELEELLGVGGMGEVWKAKNPHFDGVPPVALKFCLDEGAAQYLQNEAAVLNRVIREGRHPNIVALERTYLSAKTPCLEYEYIEGGDLSSLIREWHNSDSKPTPHQISTVFLKMVEAVAHAHSRNPPIVHRDLKPANVLRQLRSDGTSVLKVADFGIGGIVSKQAIEGQSRAVTGAGRGLFLTQALRGSCTPLYASPQQMRGGAPDPRDDIFALGVIWYQMLTGDLTATRPGGRKWPERLIAQGMDHKLTDILAECIEDNPDDRIPNAVVLVDHLNKTGLLTGMPLLGVAVKHEPPPPKPEPFEPPSSPRPLLGQPDPGGRRPNPVEAKEVQRVADLEHEVGKMAVLIDAGEQDARVWARRGELHRQLGKHDRAIADCTEAIRIDSELAQAYATRGGAYRLKGEYDMAISDCTRAVQLDPAHVLAWYHRGESYRMKGMLDRAIVDLGKALELDSGFSWAFGSRGAAYQQKGDYAKAIEDLGENLLLDPAYAWAWAVRGETYRLMKDYDRTIADCNEALKIRSDLAQALATRGAAFRQKGDFATALADLRQAIRIQPHNQFARDQQRLAEERRK